MLGGYTYQLFKCPLVSDRQVCENLAIQVNASVLESVDEPAVGYSRLTACRPDSYDPQTPEVTFSFPPVAVSVVPGMHQGLFGPLIVTVGGPVETTGGQHHFFVARVFGDSAFDSGQISTPRGKLRWSPVRQQPAQPTSVATVYRELLRVFTGNFVGFFPPEVAAHPLAAHHFSCSGDMNARFGAFVRLKFWHWLNLRPVAPFWRSVRVSVQREREPSIVLSLPSLGLCPV